MLASLSVTHGFLPPHPAPTAIADMFNADIGKTLLYGIIIAIPAIIIAGPLFTRTIKNAFNTYWSAIKRSSFHDYTYTPKQRHSLGKKKRR